MACELPGFLARDVRLLTILGLVLHCSHLAMSSAIQPVWIDCDFAVDEQLAGVRDVDDAFALFQALNSPQLDVIGVSVVFGNALVMNATVATQRVLDRFFPSSTARAVAGATSASHVAGTDAVTAMAHALRTAGPGRKIDLLALGPLTNIAALIRFEPELVRSSVKRIVFVGGRRPGQQFQVGNLTNQTLSDMNFEKDAEAARVVLDFLRGGGSVQLVLTPFEVTTHIAITAKDLDRLGSSQSPAASWLQVMSRPWLAWWSDTFGVEFFHPFDTLAVLFVTRPDQLACDAVRLSIERGPSDQVIMNVANRYEGEGGAEVHGHGVAQKWYLLARAPQEEGVLASYCHSLPNRDFAQELILDRIVASRRNDANIEL